eukprot:403331347
MFSSIFGSNKKQVAPPQTMQQTLQETFIQEQQAYHAAQSLTQISEYQKERQEKIDLINQKMVANGMELEEFLQILSTEKENGQNVDFVGLDEIIKVIEKEQTVHQDFSKLSYNDTGAKLRAGTMGNFQINRDVSAPTIKKVPQIRMTQKITGTIFNQNKNVVCEVSLPFQANHADTYPVTSLEFDVQTYPFKWKVRRTPKDFNSLRDYLLKMYPQTLIPSLPNFDPKKPKLTLRQLKKKCIYYQRFLTCVMRSQVMRSAEFLVEFLREADTEQFYAKMVTAKYNKGPERLEQIATLYGDVDVTAGKRAKRLCRKLPRYIETYDDINTFLKRKLTDLQKKSHDLADEYYAVATEVQRFSTLLKATEIPQVTQLYDKLSQIILRNGDFIMQSGEILNTQLSPWFHYLKGETQAYRDQKELVEQAKRKYETKLNELNQKKMTLFKKGDVKLWKVDDESIQEAMLVKTDQVQAFKLMLPKETQEVQAKKEEWEFFTNQAHKEIKRVTGVNYDMGREVLVNVGEMILRIIYQMNLGWQEFLSYYTGTNTDRKAYDEKFFEERGIYEEAEDQIGSSDEDEDPEDYLDDEVPGALVPDEEVYKEKKEEWRVGGEWL